LLIPTPFSFSQVVVDKLVGHETIDPSSNELIRIVILLSCNISTWGYPRKIAMHIDRLTVLAVNHRVSGRVKGMAASSTATITTKTT
jgi:hypothetical protein